MANTKDYLDQEAYEEQKENVKNLIKNVGFDYTVDQLKALANAADRIIEISEDGINVTPGPYADGVGYGLSGIATTKSSISFLKNITKYMELEEQYEGKLDDPKVQGILNSQIAQCVADGISIVTSASGFSKTLNNIPVVGLVMTTFTYGAEALSSGAAIIQSRLTYLEQLDRELDEALGWNDVADDSGVLIETYEDQVHFRNALNKLKSARSELQSADIYDGSLDSVISDIESKLNALDQKANDVINKVENKSGYHASNLSDLARACLKNSCVRKNAQRLLNASRESVGGLSPGKDFRRRRQ